MVKFLVERLRPDRGFAHFFHLSFLSIIPVLVFIFVRLELVGVALAVILISKWRMLSVQPRYWLAHVRTNAVDIIVNVSILIFMTQTNSFNWQLLWVLIYEVWILFIKPGENALAVSAQAVLGMLAGISALFFAFEDTVLGVYIFAVALIAYFASRHFFGSFDEPQAKIYSAIWAYLAGIIMWVLGHWVLFAGPIAMPAVVICSLGYLFGGLYYLNESDRLTHQLKRQIYMIVFGIMLVLVIWLLRRSTVEL